MIVDATPTHEVATVVPSEIVITPVLQPVFPDAVAARRPSNTGFGNPRYATAPVIATPVVATPAGSTAAIGAATSTAGAERPRGQWSSEWYAVFTEMQICMAVWCCSCCTVGQAYELVMRPPHARPFTRHPCRAITGVLVTTVIFAFIFWSIRAVSGIGTLLWFFFWGVFIFVVQAVRGTIRRRDNIPEESCGGGCEDCCCALFCNPCTQCQILRHEGLGGGRYDLLSSTGGSSPVAVVQAAGAYA